jgi:hypothetical protein
MWIEIAEGITVYAAGFASAYLVINRKPEDQVIREFMERIVNMEAIEEHERLLKFRMARGGLRSMRVDGGPNAVMRKMRLTPRKTTGGSTTA